MAVEKDLKAILGKLKYSDDAKVGQQPLHQPADRGVGRQARGGVRLAALGAHKLIDEEEKQWTLI